MDELSPWQQRIALPDGQHTPGKWDTARQAGLIKADTPWPLAGRLLDAGGNAGGIAVELQDVFGSILVLETGKKYQKQFEYISRQRDTTKIQFLSESLFTAHRHGPFDVILMLGLVYHFRHPQLFLDYCATLDCGRFVFSTQVDTGDDIKLWNRVQIAAYAGRGLMGWHPTRSAFELMLTSAGFRVDKAVDVSGLEFTNNHYVFCSRVSQPKFDPDLIERLSRQPLFWS